VPKRCHHAPDTATDTTAIDTGRCSVVVVLACSCQHSSSQNRDDLADSMVRRYEGS
jgi:hypothetical protein